MIVVDCSAVVDALVGEGVEELAEQLAAERLVAPMLIDFELCAALRGLVVRGELSAAGVGDALHDYDQLLITRWASARDLRDRVIELRDNVSAYDAAYVVLAEALDCPLLTRDRRLARAAAGICEVQVL